IGILLDKKELVGVEPMHTSDCLSRFERLSLRKMSQFSRSKIFATVNKQVDTALPGSTNQPIMVGGALITEGQRSGKRSVMDKEIGIWKKNLQKVGGFFCFKSAMQVRDQVGRREVDPAVSGITTGSDGSCICRPHCRCRETGRKQVRRVSPSPLDYLLIAAGESDSAKHFELRAMQGRDQSLTNP